LASRTTIYLFLSTRPPQSSPFFPYTTLFRSLGECGVDRDGPDGAVADDGLRSGGRRRAVIRCRLHDRAAIDGRGRHGGCRGTGKIGRASCREGGRVSVGGVVL